MFSSYNSALQKYYLVLPCAAFIRQLTSMSEKLSAVTKTDFSESTPLSTELLVIDLNKLSSQNPNIKVILSSSAYLISICITDKG